MKLRSAATRAPQRNLDYDGPADDDRGARVANFSPVAPTAYTKVDSDSARRHDRVDTIVRAVRPTLDSVARGRAAARSAAGGKFGLREFSSKNDNQNASFFIDKIFSDGLTVKLKGGFGIVRRALRFGSVGRSPELPLLGFWGVPKLKIIFNFFPDGARNFSRTFLESARRARSNGTMEKSVRPAVLEIALARSPARTSPRLL